MAIPMTRSESPSSLPRGKVKRIKSIAAAINQDTAEADRLRKDKERVENWKRWSYFPHEQARSRAYRWGEDGILGICDRQCRLCFALSFWNEKDPILKERLFGLVNYEGNHGEDVKECYYYLDSTPTHSYMKGLYKYPQCEYPYWKLLDENRRRGLDDPEYELEDTGVFDEGKYWDMFVEYANEDPSDILVRIKVCNRGPASARVHVLPTLWYRNTWGWGYKHEGHTEKPVMKQVGEDVVFCEHETLGVNYLYVSEDEAGNAPELLWTGNETNTEKLFGHPADTPYVKDAFHR
eukprot:Em0003g646a